MSEKRVTVTTWKAEPREITVRVTVSSEVKQIPLVVMRSGKGGAN